jgi:MFS family permease
MYRFHLFGKIPTLKFNKNSTILYLAGFVLILATSFPAYINSNFIENFVNVQYVGLFFVLANIVTFFAMLFFPAVIKKYSNLLTSKFVLLINIIALMGLILSTNPSPAWLLIFFISMWTTSNLIFINMDIFVESFTKNENTGKTRALYFTFINIGWMISPFLVSKFIVAENHYNLVYLVAALAVLIFYFIITIKSKKINAPINYRKLKIKETIQDYWKNLTLRGLYLVSLFLNIFLNSVVIFIPLYLHINLGFDWTTLGIMFSIMLLPFILVEIPAGIIADKYIGEKEIMYIGLGILTLSLFLFFMVESSNPVVWGALLLFSRIGAALIEAMRESRFFKIVDSQDISHINFLRTSYPLGYLIGSGLGALILFFYPVKFVFLFMAIIFLYSFCSVSIIKDSK